MVLGTALAVNDDGSTVVLGFDEDNGRGLGVTYSRVEIWNVRKAIRYAAGVLSGLRLAFASDDTLHSVGRDNSSSQEVRSTWVNWRPDHVLTAACKATTSAVDERQWDLWVPGVRYE